ncbi:hypothetical protein CI109_101405 [Kwoniella shandongensis]|uniref:Uncharacterized protein n=1 Tax=Kwoniella shandongensis TaxID=1734106 RepID=A0A5M6BUI5_9TREE|nr:uncharacterized protein CI109_005102 [Kwoniella shandongensis]KAA5526528.1 hypothetical protein CI109_005102 [Kwoniella shandongensis]
MEKYSKWRDPATGIQPFLPPVPPRTVSPIFVAILTPFSIFHSLARALLLAVVALIHIVLVEGVCLIFIPLPPLYRTISSGLTAVTCRLGLALMGYWWITTELVSPKRGKTGVAQISKTGPRKGDLIITNWTSYVDVLYLAFRHNPTFLLPVFSSDSTHTSAPTTGRHTGTGSANISTTFAQPPLLGYLPISLPALIARTGSLSETYSTPPKGMYKTLREARRKENRLVALFPEGTTSNGRAVLRFGEGTLAEGDVGGDDEGIVWIKFFKHTPPTPFAPSATCSLPTPLSHLIFSTLYTPTPTPSRSLHIRTLHPSASPSSPSFLPSEILANAPGGLDAAGKDHKAVWREACATVLAETGRVRRVKGMGWVEKKAFLEYWVRSGRR